MREKGASRTLEPLALACFLVWTLAALASRWTGIWAGIGGSALLLGAASLIWGRSFLAPRLVPSGRQLVLGLLAGGAMVGATYALYPLAGRWVVSVPAQTASLYATFSGARGLVRLLLLPPIIVSEELVWRGVVLESLSRRSGPAAAVFLAAAAYALAHAPAGSPLLVFIALACGVYWGLLRTFSSSLLPSLLAHLLWDVALLLLWPLAPPS